MSGHTNWRDIKHKKDLSRQDEPTQTTDQGLEIPVPKRRDVMDALRKLVQPRSPSGACA